MPNKIERELDKNKKIQDILDAIGVLDFKINLIMEKINKGQEKGKTK